MTNSFAFLCTYGDCGTLTFLYFVLFPLLAIFAASLIFYSILFIFNRLKRKSYNIKLEFKRFLLIFVVTLASVGLVVLFTVYIPTLNKDNKYKDKLESCAKQVGYSSSADDNSPIATAESQSAFRLCIDN